MKTCSKCHRSLPATTTYFNRANWLVSGLRSDCKECYSTFKKQWWASQPKSLRAHRLQKQKEASLRGMRICRTCGVEEISSIENFAVVGTGHLDTECRKCANIRTRKWDKLNWNRKLITCSDQCARRYARKKHRTPKWLTNKQFGEIRKFYELRAFISKNTGIEHHVDHIIPLVGKTVSGLHVPWNLQIIPATVNVRKSNKLVIPDA